MMRKFDIVSIGELLIDMTPASMAQNSSMVFEVNPGELHAMFWLWLQSWEAIARL